MSPREVENTEYAAFVGRVIKAAGRRVAEGDREGLAELVQLRDQLDAAIEEAVKGLRAEPHYQSWSDLARVLGVTRQAARQRFARIAPGRAPGGQPGGLR